MTENYKVAPELLFTSCFQWLQILVPFQDFPWISDLFISTSTLDCLKDILNKAEFALHDLSIHKFEFSQFKVHQSPKNAVQILVTTAY